MKIGNTEVNNTLIWIVVAVLVAIIALIWISIPPKPPPSMPTAAINEAQDKVVKQLKTQIAEQEMKVKDFQSRLSVSEGRNRILSSKIVTLQKEKESVKAPVTNQELRDRFSALGFTPLSIK